ncbi:hypothetical protein BC831DRAFT_466949 [Entophlyctis helioformis]|nr:hypothetical protein BC831DRAFT_466949 [Entophlyctis helioformis]
MHILTLALALALPHLNAFQATSTGVSSAMVHAVPVEANAVAFNTVLEKRQDRTRQRQQKKAGNNNNNTQQKKAGNNNAQQKNGGNNNNNGGNNGQQKDNQKNGGNNNNNNKPPAAEAEQSNVKPAGVNSFNPQPPVGFCRQFGNVPAADGSQRKEGGQMCSSTPQGLIPDVNKMVSTLITSPAFGSTVSNKNDITVRIDTANLATGFFALANEQYYMAPQTLDPQRGIIQGHQHITVQKLDNVNSAPNAKVFEFFKGLNEAATDNGGRKLEAVIPAGTIKQSGLYRICSITGTHTHQPVIMPVAQRGSQDDCIRLTITA